MFLKVSFDFYTDILKIANATKKNESVIQSFVFL